MISAKTNILKKIRYLSDGLLGASLGALIYALWAFFVNLEFGLLFALKVSITHWCLSTTITYYGTAVMRFCYRLSALPQTLIILRAFATFCGGIILTYGILIPIHLLIGTPNIFLTLSAGIIPTILFCFFYALLLSRTEPKNSPAIYSIN